MNVDMEPKVLIIGCGVAGPVIALLLKKKGYTPVVLEKVRELGDAGASLMMMPNGLKILALVGLADVVTQQVPHLGELRDQTYTGKTIGVSYIPAKWQSKYSQPACGIKRTTLNLTLKNALIDADIEVHEGWKLKTILEKEDSVVAISEDGKRMEGSILIGCDGIKAMSRALLLKEHQIQPEEATYTGLMQTAGMSPTPLSLQKRPGLLNLYGPRAHLICYPVTATTTSWAITKRDLTEAQETWKICSPAEMILERDSLLEDFKDWSSPALELIRGAERIIKYGLYDRPHLEPKLWYSPKPGRCVLIGDAAHPTSPHLGQGANQALEDCYHLSQMLPTFDHESDADISVEDLQRVFNQFSTLRQPRTAALVKGARAQGSMRVISGGIAACEERDKVLSKGWEDEAAVEVKYDSLFKETFQ
ncbi:hypothetical protein V499_00268 [Pseudogymnoascus sp. VKM F-103]|uniref:FAD-binding domain-containing protein n=1 Tax=Pseudogymnoascus verrucosus TaxID=342668 RepID=A0A2P2SYA0_9PEZI|nr:uncharacterized protein VE01_00378 [Pseudogymnoascus verrucosus]KFY80935.1 hypothetical protein V499_00268 [Pseudogymnoascus sp. VKM F-103]OBU01838.2 hypothetical protein VE01_00378 [Pseudogymnoascus verrucosus]